jgi:1-aminocyclopropane-1-carboxylate synthase
LLLTPGETCHAAEPGFFRICWAWAPAAAMGPLVARLVAVLADAAAAKQ